MRMMCEPTTDHKHVLNHKIRNNKQPNPTNHISARNGLVGFGAILIVFTMENGLPIFSKFFQCAFLIVFVIENGPPRFS